MTPLSVITVETPSLGDRSYLAHDGTVAVVIDPQRDIDRVLALLDQHRLQLEAVFETHVHNDYLTGGLALAAATGASYHVNAEDPVGFERTPIRDGDQIAVGERMAVTALATPGHTFTHLSYALYDGDLAVAVFTGGSLLYGAAGRPDLLGPEHTDELVRLQRASVHRLADLLPDATDVYPTHGFGSFCAATQTDAKGSTIGQERRTNPALTEDEQAWVAELLAGLDVWPAYYARMATANLAGPAVAQISRPAPAEADELRRRIEAGEWVVDLRARIAFAAGHLPGSLNFGLDGAFVTYLGWLVEPGAPVTLLAETREEIAEAQLELSRIGIEQPAGAATGKVADWTSGDPASYRIATFADLAQVVHHRAVVVLDVRRRLEWASAHVLDAVHLPLHQLPHRLTEIPDGEVWVHCAGGYRASIAASFLAAAGRRVVSVDDDFARVAELGLQA